MQTIFLPKLPNDWASLLASEVAKPYFKKLNYFLAQAYAQSKVFPPLEKVFSALEYTDYANTKVVILGQDPYHNDNQAQGLSFSVDSSCQLPPSLKNIYRELRDDCHCRISSNGSLVSWAKQGVLLLNTVLTVQAHMANSHRQKGWEIFTDRIIELLNEHPQPIVFMLWGNPAQQKQKLITNPKHLILKAAHPSPLSASRGFFGCRHFSKANEFLISHNLKPIDWEIPPAEKQQEFKAEQTSLF